MLDIDWLESRIQQLLEENITLGMSLAVIEEGSIQYQKGFGRTSITEQSVAVTPRTLFSYSSICKMLCATLVMRLVEKGDLELDRPVIDYLPGYQFSNQSYGAKITLKQLISHTTGLPQSGKSWGPRDADALRRYCWEELTRHRFMGAPGQFHHYSNTAIVLAGHLAEVVTGQNYDDLLDEMLFAPLNMEHSFFDMSKIVSYPIALPHKAGDNGELEMIPRLPDNYAGHPASFCYGPLEDLMQVAAMYLNGGHWLGQDLLKPETIALMHTPVARRQIETHSHPIAHVVDGYGLGFATGTYRGTRVARHGGGGGWRGYNSHFDLFPDEGKGIVLLSNYVGDGFLTFTFELYDKLLKLPDRQSIMIPLPKNAAIKSKELPETGRFINPAFGTIIELANDGENRTVLSEGEIHPLTAFKPNQYFYTIPFFGEELRIPLTFCYNASHSFTHLMFGGEPYIPLSEVATPDGMPPAEWIPGRYKDPNDFNPDSPIDIVIEDGVLKANELNGDVVDCLPLGNQHYVSSYGLFSFTKEVGGTPILQHGFGARLWKQAE